MMSPQMYFSQREFCDYWKPNAQVNRQKCGAFLSVLNLQLGWRQVRH
jgi:hypothetical protein